MKQGNVRASEATHEARKAHKRLKTLNYQKQEEEEGIIYDPGAFENI